MAAPASKTIADLNGKWVMNKTLSDNTEPSLALQGVGYLTRKGIGLATVTLHVKQYTADGCVHVDIEQTATGGIKGTTENRQVDGVPRSHSDWLFGTAEASSYWVQDGIQKAAASHGLDAGSAEYLAANWLEGPEEKTGPDGAAHLASVADNKKDGWIAVQIWGFQNIGGERRYARSIVLKKGDKKVEMRLVYDYAG